MKQLQPVVWSRGVLLAPQHLQTQDRFLEDSMQFKLSALTYCRWGFQQLSIDQEAVAAGELHVRSAAGLFPDGLLFDFPSADAAPPPKPIRDAWQPDQTALTVYLAIPEYRDGGSNVAATKGEAAARYISDVVLARDENTGESEKAIEVGRKNLRLLAGNESRDGHSTLPIARVLRAANGAMQLDPHFVPPLLDFSASPYLSGIVSELLERLSSRSHGLAAVRQQRNQSLADFGITGVASFWLLYTVNSHLPLIRHLQDTRHGHPAQLFEAMLSLAGSLTTFSTDLTPASLAAYDHDDLGASFHDLARDVFTLLDTVIPKNCVALAFQRIEGRTVHKVSLDDDRFDRSDEMYLAVHSRVGQAELLTQAAGLKVGSLEQVEQLVKQSLPGLKLTHTTHLPDGVRLKLDHEYFRIQPDGDAWRSIRMTRTLAVHAPADLRDASFELVVVLPRD
jgi:type VI secretion system protein ImpJ